MSGQIKDIMLIIAGIAILAIGLPRVFNKNTSAWKRILMILLLVLFTWLSIDQYFRNRTEKTNATTEKQENTKTIKDLKSEVMSLRDTISKMYQFEQAVKGKFNVRDSAGFPVKNVYNTSIKNAKEVHIGG